MDNNVVYVVHAIDTEGPLHESLKATFYRLKSIFDVNLAPSKETLKKLQHKEIDLKEKEEAVANLVAPRRLEMNSTWDKLDNMLDTITSNEFRNKYPDSIGNGWIYNWFCMDHVGFNGRNPRRRDIGFHNIFDHYQEYMELNNIARDSIQFHYHPLAPINDANHSGTTYLNSSNIYDILTRKVIDRLWFPAAYRPGFHTERPDSNWFLEQWIPFDFANQSMDKVQNNQPDLSKARFGDWRRAPISWIPYNPDLYDYQKKGSCNRYIARCLNMEARHRELQPSDVELAFEEAQQHGKSLLSFTNHDFRDMIPEINKIWNMISNVSKQYDDVIFQHVNAVEGYRKTLDLSQKTPPDFDVEIINDDNFSKLNVSVNHEIFGVQPFLALKTKTNDYIWQNFDFESKNKWSFTFDYSNIEIKAIDKIGIAANTSTGVTEVVVLDAHTGEKKKKVLNQ